MENHVKHFDDCGCKSKRYEDKLKLLIIRAEEIVNNYKDTSEFYGRSPAGNMIKNLDEAIKIAKGWE